MLAKYLSKTTLSLCFRNFIVICIVSTLFFINFGEKSPKLDEVEFEIEEITEIKQHFTEFKWCIDDNFSENFLEKIPFDCEKLMAGTVNEFLLNKNTNFMIIYYIFTF